ncbi:MAG: hypothetical protein JW985_01500 [Alphaproteobacteria bacterium]|nr:hypothetical protein [Alphaproteobacteria bacterium]
MIKKLVFFAFLFLSIPIFAFGADCEHPVSCENAIGCEVVFNFGKINNDYTINDLIADAILKNLQGVCSDFKFEYGWNNFSVGDNLSVDWGEIKTIVIDKFNYDPNSKNFTFLVTENPWYVIGGRATGIIVGSVIVAGAVACAISGVCAVVGASTAVGATVWSAGATAVVTSQNIAIASSKLEVRKTMSDWEGCVNITDNGVTDTISDLFTTDVIRPTFPELRGNKFAFNASSGNILFKNGEMFSMTVEQKNKIISQVPNIADKGACDGKMWKLYLYPVRIFLQDINGESGQWKFDLRMENDSVLIDN